jgi:hypothetical protein
MKTRTWPYGTRKEVTVIDVIPDPPEIMVACLEEATQEAFICIYRLGAVRATKGQHGTLTFTQGGLTGGYWAFQAEVTYH